MKGKKFFRKKGQYILFVLVLLIFIFLYGMDHCFKEWQGKRLSYQGIVTKKYQDSTNHNFYTVELNGSDKRYLVDFGSRIENEKVYNQISIGDSVLKIKGSDELHLFTKEGKKEFTIDYGCENDWLQNPPRSEWDSIPK
jgi:hypothetical protein